MCGHGTSGDRRNQPPLPLLVPALLYFHQRGDALGRLSRSHLPSHAETGAAPHHCCTSQSGGIKTSLQPCWVIRTHQNFFSVIYNNTISLLSLSVLSLWFCPQTIAFWMCCPLYIHDRRSLRLCAFPNLQIAPRNIIPLIKCSEAQMTNLTGVLRPLVNRVPEMFVQ